MSKSLSFYNLTGGLNIVQDLGNINSTPNRTESPDMMNMEYYKLGGIQVMKGNTQLGQTIGGQAITCGYEYIIGNNSYMIITTEQDNVYEYNKLTKQFVWVGKLDSGPERPYSARHSMVGYDNGVVIVNGHGVAYYNRTAETPFEHWIPVLKTTETISGTEKTVLTTFHPVCVASYRGRLFMGANKVEQTIDGVASNYNIGMLFYSGVGLGIPKEDPDNPGEYLPWGEGAEDEDAGAFKEFFEDTSNFTALGTWAEYLVVHKQQNTFMLDGTGDLSSDWTLKPYSIYTTPSQQSYVIANNGYYTYIPEANGIYPLLNRTIYNSTYQGGEISNKIKDAFDNIDNERYNEIYATYNPRKKYLLFYFPMRDNFNQDGEYNGSGVCYIYDILTRSWLRRKVPQYVTCVFNFNNETYIGTKDGKVLQEFKGKTFDGTPIEFYYLTPPFIWGGGTNKTTTKEFRIKLVNQNANHFYVESFKDGNLYAKESRLVKNVNDNLNGLVWDLDFNYPEYQDVTRTVTIDGEEVEQTTRYLTVLHDWNEANFEFKEASGDTPAHWEINKTNTLVYHYQYDGQDYYTLEPIIVGQSFNVKVYGDPELENFIDYNQFITITRDAQEGETPTSYRYIQQKSYAWNQRQLNEWCYKNGNYYAWVHQGTGACRTNLKTETYTAWQGFILESDGQANFRATPSYYQSILSAQANGAERSFIPYYSNNQMQFYHDGSWKTSFTRGDETFSWGIKTNTQQFNHDEKNYVLILYNVTYNSYFPTNGNDNLPTDSFGTETATKEVPSGTSPISNKGIQPTRVNSITINVTGVGNITLNRYTEGDIGNAIGTISYYTTSSNPVVNTDYLYDDVQCTTNPRLITQKTSTTITAGGVTYVRYSQADSNRSVPVGQISISVFSLIDKQRYPEEIQGSKPVYDYPEIPTADKMVSITDTVWDYSDSFTVKDSVTGEDVEYPADLPSNYDSYSEIPPNLRGDAWLYQGYQTKRMLLPNQYFETVQFKFSGGGYDLDGNPKLDDSICISGFEVDGIQLVETPWA